MNESKPVDFEEDDGVGFVGAGGAVFRESVEAGCEADPSECSSRDGCWFLVVVDFSVVVVVVVVVAVAVAVVVVAVVVVAMASV
jgi:hypothetical protein